MLGMTIPGKASTLSKMNPPSPPAFRAEPVELARTSGTDIRQFAHELEISEQALRGWLERADIDARRARRVDYGGAGLYCRI